MNIPNHYKLVEETPQAYEIHDERDGRNFHISKKNLNLEMHGKLSKIKKYSKGGKIASNDDFGYIAEMFTPDMEAAQERFDRQAASLPKTVEEARMMEASQGIPPSPAVETPAATVEVAETQPVSTEAPVVKPKEAEQAQPKKSYLEEERENLKKGAQAEQRASQQQAQEYKRAAQKLDSMETPEQIYQRGRAQDQELEKEYRENKIDPRRVIDNMTTGRKVVTAIGLIFGGMGGGGTGKNAALDQLNKAIDDDILAQKNAQDKAYNLWKMNREATQSDMQATLETRNQLLQAAKVRIEQFSAEAAGPMAQARAAPLLAQIDKEIEENTLRRSFMEASRTQGIINADPTVLLRGIKDHHLQKEAGKEIQEMQNLKRMETNVLGAMDELQKINQVLSPFDAARAKGTFTGTLVKMMEGSFTKEQAESFAKNFFKRIGEGSATTENKRRDFINLIKTKQVGSFFQAATGIPLDKFASTSLDYGTESPQQKAINLKKQWVIENQNNPDPAIQKVIQYTKRKYGF
jgi:hypothetical protein